MPHKTVFQIENISILSVVVIGLQSNCDTTYSSGGVNQMWILKTLKSTFQFKIISIFPLLTVGFQFICSNIPAAPDYGVYISQLTRYANACSSYHDVLDKGLLLTMKLLIQGFLVIKLKS